MLNCTSQTCFFNTNVPYQKTIFIFQRPPCQRCGSLDHWFPDPKELLYSEAERRLYYLELLRREADKEWEKEFGRKQFRPSHVQVGINSECRDKVNEIKDKTESKDGPNQVCDEGSQSGGEGHDKKREVIPPWKRKEIHELLQDKATEQAFLEDLEFFKVHRECCIAYMEQLRSRLGQCGVKRNHDSAMLTSYMQC